MKRMFKNIKDYPIPTKPVWLDADEDGKLHIVCGDMPDNYYDPERMTRTVKALTNETLAFFGIDKEVH